MCSVIHKHMYVLLATEVPAIAHAILPLARLARASLLGGDDVVAMLSCPFEGFAWVNRATCVMRAKMKQYTRETVPRLDW